MLRLITVHREDGYRLELHGTLGGEWVRLLEKHWRALAHNGGAPHAVTVVLSNVDFIDADGERLLRRMAASGVEFEVSGCMNRYVVEKLQAGTSKRGVRP